MNVPGVSEFENTRLSFDVIHLSQTHPSCKYLSGLLDMFKEKIPHKYVNPIIVSVRFTHELRKFKSNEFVSKRKFAFDDRNNYAENVNDTLIVNNEILPFGVSLDPVRELILYCTWPEIAENVVMDSRNYSDFDPITAPQWSFRMRFEAIPISFMSECINEYIQQCESTKPLSDILGIDHIFQSHYNLNIPEEYKPLERLTESKISKFTSSVLSVALPNMGASVDNTQKKAKGIDGPLREEQLMAMLYYLFPDAKEKPTNSYPGIVPDIVRSFL